MGVLRGGTDSEGVPLKRADLGAIDLQIRPSLVAEVFLREAKVNNVAGEDGGLSV